MHYLTAWQIRLRPNACPTLRTPHGARAIVRLSAKQRFRSVATTDIRCDTAKRTSTHAEMRSCDHSVIGPGGRLRCYCAGVSTLEDFTFVQMILNKGNRIRMMAMTVIGPAIGRVKKIVGSPDDNSSD